MVAVISKGPHDCYSLKGIGVSVLELVWDLNATGCSGLEFFYGGESPNVCPEHV